MTDPDLRSELSDDDLRPRNTKIYQNNDGSFRYEDAGPKDTWAESKPKIPEEDIRKCYKILNDLTLKYRHKSVDGSVKVWYEIQQMARYQFDKIGIQAHVEIELFTRYSATKKEVKLTLLSEDADTTLGYKIVDGKFVVPSYVDGTIMVVPVIILDDYSDLDKKKSKAEQSIVEREVRRSQGDSYHVQGKDVKGG